ncbi:thiol:disulfide interchange protein DsbA/DsbL [Arenimonas sp.]|uniref:thiol:disulfide interchange protein DsbA/DsbL n=1 Tax=Arenimonas sp. TaxID=1872635 RepID=UPI0039E4207B
MIRRLFALHASAILLLLAPLLAYAQAAPVAAPAPRVGVDYIELPEPMPQFVAGKIEIAEFFSYACGHCARFQPYVNEWHKKQKPGSDVRWEYLPAPGNTLWSNFAKSYLAAQTLGVAEKTHDSVFKAIHQERFFNTGSLEEIADMYARFGVDRKKFLATVYDPAIDAKLAKIEEFAMARGLGGTPTLVVAGRYVVPTTNDRGFEGQIATADYLVAKVRAAQPKAKAKQGKTGKTSTTR